MQRVKRIGVVHCKTKKMKKDCEENVEVLYDRFATTNTIDNSISPNQPNIVRMLKGNCPVVRWDNAVTNFP